MPVPDIVPSVQFRLPVAVRSESPVSVRQTRWCARSICASGDIQSPDSADDRLAGSGHRAANPGDGGGFGEVRVARQHAEQIDAAVAGLCSSGSVDGTELATSTLPLPFTAPAVQFKMPATVKSPVRRSFRCDSTHRGRQGDPERTLDVSAPLFVNTLPAGVKSNGWLSSVSVPSLVVNPSVSIHVPRRADQSRIGSN